MSNRQRIPSGGVLESRIGFSRAVRVGAHVMVSGTAPIGPDGSTVALGDAAGQARHCLEVMRKSIVDAGGTLADIVRTRVLLTRIEDWDAVARVHGEFFSDVRPACTVMEVSAFIDPSWLVEIEADAILHDPPADA